MKRFIILTIAFPIIFINSISFAQTDDSGAKNTVYYESDATWRVSKTEIDGWKEVGFDDREWELSVDRYEGLCGRQYKLNKIGVYPMWMYNPIERETVYFRKTIYLDFDPSEANMFTILDDDGEIYINGFLVRKDTSGSVNTEPFKDNVRQYLHKGENIIAIKVADSFGGCQSLSVMLEVSGDLESHIELGVPIIKQTDPQWSSTVYSGGGKNALDCGNTIGECGCVISSLAMLMNYYGIEKDPYGKTMSPASLNSYFQENQRCFESGCLSKGYAYGYVIWPAVNIFALEAHDKFQSQKIIWNGLSEYDRPTVINEIKNYRPVILKAGDKEHWVVAKGEDSQTITINDPYFDAKKLNDALYKNTATKISRFMKTNSDFSMIYVVSPSPQQILITDPKGRRTGFDKISNTVLKEIPNADYYLDKQPNLIDASSQNGVYVAVVSLPESGAYVIEKILPVTTKINEKDVAIYSYSQNGATNFFPFRNSMQTTLMYEKGATSQPMYKPVKVDIMPHKTLNKINCRNMKEKISAAIYSSKDFNVKEVNLKTIVVAGENFEPISWPAGKRNYMYRDLNKDRKNDLIINLKNLNTKVICASDHVIVEGKTKDGMIIKGKDKIVRKYN